MDRWNWQLLVVAVVAGVLAFMAAIVQCIPGCEEAAVCRPGCPESAYALPLALLAVVLLTTVFVRSRRR